MLHTWYARSCGLHFLTIFCILYTYDPSSCLSLALVPISFTNVSHCLQKWYLKTIFTQHFSTPTCGHGLYRLMPVTSPHYLHIFIYYKLHSGHILPLFFKRSTTARKQLFLVVVFISFLLRYLICRIRRHTIYPLYS